jgi:hypothetical protein
LSAVYFLLLPHATISNAMSGHINFFIFIVSCICCKDTRFIAQMRYSERETSNLLGYLLG